MHGTLCALHRHDFAAAGLVDDGVHLNLPLAIVPSLGQDVHQSRLFPSMC